MHTGIAVIVLTTLGEGDDARGIATALVEQRLAACVNIVPQIYSVYRWQEQVAHDGEQLLVIKTTHELVAALREALFARHPYEVPEFVVLQIDEIHGAYRQWLLGAVNPSSS